EPVWVSRSSRRSSRLTAAERRSKARKVSAPRSGLPSRQGKRPTPDGILLFLRRSRSSLVGLRARRARSHARHHRLGDDLPAPLPGAPRARSASGPEPLLPLLAVADDRHGDPRVGGGPPQAP